MLGYLDDSAMRPKREGTMQGDQLRSIDWLVHSKTEATLATWTKHQVVQASLEMLGTPRQGQAPLRRGHGAQ